MEKFAKPGDYCPNAACLDYDKLHSEQQAHIERFGSTRKGVQRDRCKTCRKTLTATFGTIFYRKRTPEREILETLALLAEGSRISTLTRTKGFKEDTILAWLREAPSMPSTSRWSCCKTSGSSAANWMPSGQCLFNGRQARKTLAFSKDLQAYRASATWEDSYYNLICPRSGTKYIFFLCHPARPRLSSAYSSPSPAAARRGA